MLCLSYHVRRRVFNALKFKNERKGPRQVDTRQVNDHLFVFVDPLDNNDKRPMATKAVPSSSHVSLSTISIPVYSRWIPKIQPRVPDRQPSLHPSTSLFISSPAAVVRSRESFTTRKSLMQLDVVSNHRANKGDMATTFPLCCRCIARQIV